MAILVVSSVCCLTSKMSGTSYAVLLGRSGVFSARQPSAFKRILGVSVVGTVGCMSGNQRVAGAY